ncbi:uncharacterized protein LOC142803748 [Rhipicephalus microplus]|uniref:uncharacterized protein LOC142803748 n=1 Tax=Rhipicephalus microplus TaxID=6941 RepID=UPI003F6D3963
MKSSIVIVVAVVFVGVFIEVMPYKFIADPACHRLRAKLHSNRTQCGTASTCVTCLKGISGWLLKRTAHLASVWYEKACAFEVAAAGRDRERDAPPLPMVLTKGKFPN